MRDQFQVLFRPLLNEMMTAKNRVNALKFLANTVNQ